MSVEPEAPDPQPPLRYVVDSHRGWGIAFALAIVLGSWGPWVTAGPETTSGIGSGGVMTFFVGLWVLVLVTVRRKRVARLTSAVFMGGLGVMALPVASSGQSHDAVLGWGLLLVLAGSAGLAVWSIATIATTPTLDWCDAVFKVIGAVVLLWFWTGVVYPADDETTGSRSAASLERTQAAEASDDETPATSTNSSPGKAKDSCEALDMWAGGGAEGSCTGPDGKTMFHFANGDSTLNLYEIAVRNVSVETTPVIAGDGRRRARASGTWVQVTVTVRNQGRGPIRTDPVMFYLDDGERTIAPDRKAMVVSRRSCYHRYAKPVQPGKEATCWVAFDVRSERADDVARSGALSVMQPSDVGEDKFSQPVGYVRLRDAARGTSNGP